MNINTPADIIEEVKSLMKSDTNINSQIEDSNHLLNKQIDYKLITKYNRPIEFKVLSTPNANLSLAGFLVYAGERMNFDFVDLLFGKYNELDKDQFITRLSESSRIQIKNIINEIDIESSILTIDETSVCKTFVIRSKDEFYLIVENWQV